MKEQVWDAMLDAEMNVRYYDYLSRRYYKYDLISKICLTVFAVGTVISWIFAEKYQLIWKALSSLVALVSIPLIFFNWNKKLKNMAILKGKWSSIVTEYEILWSKMDSRSDEVVNVEKDYRRIKQIEEEISFLEEEIPIDKKLIEECQDEVIKARGL